MRRESQGWRAAKRISLAQSRGSGFTIPKCQSFIQKSTDGGEQQIGALPACLPLRPHHTFHSRSSSSRKRSSEPRDLFLFFSIYLSFSGWKSRSKPRSCIPSYLKPTPSQAIVGPLCNDLWEGWFICMTHSFHEDRSFRKDELRPSSVCYRAWQTRVVATCGFAACFRYESPAFKG